MPFMDAQATSIQISSAEFFWRESIEKNFSMNVFPSKIEKWVLTDDADFHRFFIVVKKLIGLPMDEVGSFGILIV